MIAPTHRTASRLLLGAAALIAVLAVVAFFVIGRGPSPHLLPESASEARTASTDPEAKPATAQAPWKDAATAPASTGPATPTTSAAAPAAAAPIFTLARTAEGRIAPESLAEFTSQPYPGDPPAYDGEPVTAYIAVPSTGRKVALTVNQLGEFPRIPTEPGEQVEVRLAFHSTGPGNPIALAARDGGKLNAGKVSAALPLDASRQLAFGFTVSPNVGMHQISVTTPAGEIKTLEFWAGPPPILMHAAK